LLLGLGLHPDVFAGASQRVLDGGVARCRLRVATQEVLDNGEGLAVLFERVARPRAKQPKLLAQELHQQRLFCREVAVDRTDADARLAGYVVDLCVRTVLGKHSPRALEDPLAVSACVRTQRALGIGQHSVGHSVFTRLA
jgi:hypothetical protein